MASVEYRVNPLTSRPAISAKAVIFDMDGVIVDSEPRHERAFFEVARELGYENPGLRFADYIGRSDKELWIDFIARHSPTQSLEDLLAMKRERVVEIIRREQPLFNGLVPLVHNLAAYYRLAVASGSERLVIEEVLNLEGLHRFFPVVVSGSEVLRGKPAPDIFLRAAELLGVVPTDCCVVEDSKPGLAAALSAGMQVIAITNTHPADELRPATFVVSTYSEIEQLLARSQAQSSNFNASKSAS
jgi:HAD superfamily hydrolase (TIGR01509 family)